MKLNLPIAAELNSVPSYLWKLSITALVLQRLPLCTIFARLAATNKTHTISSKIYVVYYISKTRENIKFTLNIRIRLVFDIISYKCRALHINRAESFEVKWLFANQMHWIYSLMQTPISPSLQIQNCKSLNIQYIFQTLFSHIYFNWIYSIASGWCFYMKKRRSIFRN